MQEDGRGEGSSWGRGLEEWVFVLIIEEGEEWYFLDAGGGVVGGIEVMEGIREEEGVSIYFARFFKRTSVSFNCLRLFLLLSILGVEAPRSVLRRVLFSPAVEI